MLNSESPASEPNLIAPVSAFRYWRVRDGALCSRRTDVVWADRLLRAACRPKRVEDFAREPHDAPGPHCHCGIHAFYDPPDDAPRIDFRAVSGIVTVWGGVAVHPEGMRVEYARIEALAIYRRWTRRQQAAVMRVAAELEVHVLDLAELKEAAPDYAPPLPASLRPVPAPQRRRLLGRRAAMPPERRIVIGF